MSDFAHIAGRSNIVRMGRSTNVIDLDAERILRNVEIDRARRDARSARRAARTRAASRFVQVPAVPGRDGPDAA